MTKEIIKIAILLLRLIGRTAVTITSEYQRKICLIPYFADNDKTPWVLLDQKKTYNQQKMVWAYFEGKADKKDKNNPLKATFGNMKELNIDQLQWYNFNAISYDQNEDKQTFYCRKEKGQNLSPARYYFNKGKKIMFLFAPVHYFDPKKKFTWIRVQDLLDEQTPVPLDASLKEELQYDKPIRKCLESLVEQAKITEPSYDNRKTSIFNFLKNIFNST